MIVIVYLELVVAPDGEKDLSNPDPSCGAMGLAIGTPHSSLEPEQANFDTLHFVEVVNIVQKIYQQISGVNCYKSWLS